MPMQKLLGLPPISSELKPILPFLQRAEELKNQDSIIAYWCAYYAAQIGITLKARDSASRDVLFSLLGALESMKKEIGNVDAIEIEVASAAYVENFALRVFNSADKEDRTGAATKATARKFLAASNFLEVLKTFPKADVSESIDEKIRYAKWKAADIARAFREGRKPTPGPAGQEQDPQSAGSPPLIQDTSAPSHLDQLDIAFANVPPPGEGRDTPGTWSTTATPGAGDSHTSLPPTSTASYSVAHGSPPKSMQKSHSRSASGSSTGSGSGSGPSKSQRARVSEEMEGKTTPSSSPPRSSAMKSSGRNGSPEGKKTVHFAPSTVETLPSLPKPPSPAEIYLGPPSIYAPPSSNSTPSPPSISPPTGASLSGMHPVPTSSSSLSHNSNIYAPQPPHQPGYEYPPIPSVPYPSIVPPPPQIPASDPPMALTPGTIAKAQKHCRFAISALDYEDAEQAKKELRAALTILGGL